jgi:broad-specificity NMP kinase
LLVSYQFQKGLILSKEYNEFIKREKTFSIDVDEDILDLIVDLDVDKEEARIMVRNNKHNCITATYYLLMVKKARNPLSITKNPPK